MTNQGIRSTVYLYHIHKSQIQVNPNNQNSDHFNQKEICHKSRNNHKLTTWPHALPPLTRTSTITDPHIGEVHVSGDRTAANLQTDEQTHLWALELFTNSSTYLSTTGIGVTQNFTTGSAHCVSLLHDPPWNNPKIPLQINPAAAPNCDMSELSMIDVLAQNTLLFTHLHVTSSWVRLGAHCCHINFTYFHLKCLNPNTVWTSGQGVRD